MPVGLVTAAAAAAAAGGSVAGDGERLTSHATTRINVM